MSSFRCRAARGVSTLCATNFKPTFPAARPPSITLGSASGPACRPRLSSTERQQDDRRPTAALRCTKLGDHSIRSSVSTAVLPRTRRRSALGPPLWTVETRSHLCVAVAGGRERRPGADGTTCSYVTRRWRHYPHALRCTKVAGLPACPALHQGTRCHHLFTACSALRSTDVTTYGTCYVTRSLAISSLLKGGLHGRRRSCASRLGFALAPLSGGSGGFAT